MNLAASICPDNVPVKEGLFFLLTNGFPYTSYGHAGFHRQCQILAECGRSGVTAIGQERTLASDRYRPIAANRDRLQSARGCGSKWRSM